MEGLTLNKRTKRYKQLMSSKESNEMFEKASAPMKRIIIAKDVLEQIRVHNITPTCGDYFLVETPYIGETDKSKVSLQDAFHHMEPCNVCALGGMFYSAIAINNKYKVDVEDQEDGELDGNVYDTPMRKKLGKFFSDYQMGLIESAFEGGDFMDEAGVYNLSEAKEEEIDRAGDFCIGLNAEKGMKKIMENIVKNEGTFRP